MPATGQGGQVATFARVRSRPWLPLLLTTVLVVGCSPDSGPGSDQPDASPTPAPDVPTRPPPPEDVAGVVDEVTVNDLSISGSGLYPDGSGKDEPVPVDQDAVDATVAAAVDWMDRHLTDLQDGGDGLVVEAGLEGDPAPVSQGMAGPDHPVTQAEYVVTVGARGTPEWVRVSVIADREDGSMSANFVFLPGGDGVTLLAAQPGEGTPVAAP